MRVDGFVCIECDSLWELLGLVFEGSTKAGLLARDSARAQASKGLPGSGRRDTVSVPVRETRCHRARRESWASQFRTPVIRWGN